MPDTIKSKLKLVEAAPRVAHPRFSAPSRHGLDSRRHVSDGLRTALSGGAPGPPGRAWTASGSTATRSPTSGSAASSRPPGTSRSPRSRRTRPTIPARCRRCCTPGRWSSSSRRPGRSRQTSATGGVTCAAPTGATRTAPRARSRPRAASGRARRVRRRRGLRPVGGQGAAHRSRVGVRRPRRPGRRRVRLGRRVHARRPLMANTWQGSSPGRTCCGRLRGHVAGRRFPAERLRPATT